MKVEKISYGDIATRGLDLKIEELCGRGDFIAVGCHRGERRSGAAIRLLTAAGIPVANILQAKPAVNYEDFTGYRFTVSEDGLRVPGKTDMPFRHLILFHDGDKEEVVGIRKVREILAVEAQGALDTLVLAEVRDEEGLMGLA